MKKLLCLLIIVVGTATVAVAKQPTKSAKTEGYQFTDGALIPTTSVKDQYRSGTCWCFSALSFLENEIMREGGEELDLSEMWIVRNIYFEKAVKYVRLHGALNFAVGSESHDVLNGIRKYGIVPEEVYPGYNYGTKKAEFAEIDAVLKAYVDAIIKAPNKGKLTTAWQEGLNGILDAYFGQMPETFTYKGKSYTPKTFAESLPVKMDNYISLTSFTHQPYYAPYVIEVPDNWAWESAYNLPLDELMSTIDSSLKSGYSVSWSTDVSEQGFSRAKAIAIVPEDDVENMSGTDAEKWGRLTAAEKDAALYSFDSPIKQKSITAEMRQTAFDNYETTDDHGMVIIGTAVDQEGNQFYKVKNSWGTRSAYNGYYYFSRPFVEYKTISVIVNKKAIPDQIREKLIIK